MDGSLDLNQDIESTENAGVYAFLRRTRADMIGHLDRTLPIEAAIAKATASTVTLDDRSANRKKDIQAAQRRQVVKDSSAELLLPAHPRRSKRIILLHLCNAVLQALDLFLTRMLVGSRGASLPRAVAEGIPIPGLIDKLIVQVGWAPKRTTGRRFAAKQALRALQALKTGLEERALSRGQAHKLVKLSYSALERLLLPSISRHFFFSVYLAGAALQVLAFLNAVAAGNSSVAIVSVCLAVFTTLVFRLSSTVMAVGKEWSNAQLLLRSLDERIAKLFEDSDENSDTILQP